MSWFQMRTCLVAVGIGGGLLTVIVTPARAQDSIGTFRPDRPNRSLFGGGGGGPASQSLVFTGRVGGGGSRSTGTEGGTEDIEPSRSSVTFAHVSGSLDYSLERRRLGAAAGVASAMHRALGSNGGTLNSTSARGQIRLDVTSRTEVRSDVGIAREPLSVLSLEPGITDGTGPATTPLDYGLSFGLDSYLQYRLGVAVRQGLSSRADLEFRYYRSYVQYSPSQENTGGEMLARFRYRLGQGLTARLGYGRDDVLIRADDDGAGERYAGHRFDAGVDFQRTLSLSRRTALNISSGTVMFSERGRRRYEVVGTAGLRREMGRSWYSTLGYDRALSFVTVFRRPTFTESISASLAGSLGRRVSVVSMAGASRGRIGLGDAANRYSAYRAGSGLTVGLNRTFGLGVHYSYFQYRFDRTSELPDVFSQREVAGHAVRVGLELFAPIFHRAGRP